MNRGILNGHPVRVFRQERIGKMTKRHFERIAATINGDLACAANDSARVAIFRIALSLADIFAQENERFNRTAFYSACGFSVDIESGFPTIQLGN